MFFRILKYGRLVDLSLVSGLQRQSVSLFPDILSCYFETLGVGLIYNRVRVRDYQSFICFTDGIVNVQLGLRKLSKARELGQ